MSGISTAIWSGTFTMYGVEVRCHTLDDGRRVIEADSVKEIFRALAEGAEAGPGQEDLIRWQAEGVQS